MVFENSQNGWKTKSGAAQTDTAVHNQKVSSPSFHVSIISQHEKRKKENKLVRHLKSDSAESVKFYPETFFVLGKREGKIAYR